METLQTSGLSERERTGANIARICHAEGRGFESHHPLLEKPRLTTRGFVFNQATLPSHGKEMARLALR
jgi:hypothetical protein